VSKSIVYVHHRKIDQPIQLSLLNYKKSGEKFWLSISVTPIYDKSGNLIQWLSIGRDITIYKNEELRKAFKEKFEPYLDNPKISILSFQN
jgi:PAS domain S-box-containing protein